MKITYLNPERVPLEKVPAGWMLKTEMHTDYRQSYRAWSYGLGGFYNGFVADTVRKDWSFITQLDLPPEYLFDFDGSGLSFNDPNYRAAVEKAAKDGKRIECISRFVGGQKWGIASRIDWSNYFHRIHPRHAAEYGLSAEKIAMMEGRMSIPEVPGQPDLDDPDYWRARQDDLRVQWARDPEMKRQAWLSCSMWVNVEHVSWLESDIYRPAPKPKSQEELDHEAFDAWAETTCEYRPKEAFFAGIEHARKGGAK